MRKSLALVLLGVLLFNPKVLRFTVRLLLELFKDPRFRRLILRQIIRWLHLW